MVAFVYSLSSGFPTRWFIEKSVRTLQGWEQGRKQPGGPARTLLTIAQSNPKSLLAVADK